MKKLLIVAMLSLILAASSFQNAAAQCSICTRTAQQLGEKPARGMNGGIIYLASAPFLLAGYIFYRWKKSNHTD